MARTDLARDTVNGHGQHRRSKSLRGQIDDWLDLIERRAPSAPQQSEAPTPPVDVTGPAAPVAAEPHLDAVDTSRDRGPSIAETHPQAAGTSHSVVVGTADFPAERVVLLCDGDRFRHAGTVMPRGAAAPALASYVEVGLTAEQAAAVEFVASWFGAPFDAVNTADDHVLCWGIWSFGGRSLARCLAGWKQRAPQAFDAFLGRYGIDVAVPPGGAPTITVALPRGGYVLGGRSAMEVIAGNAGLVAALARVGRESTAQLAQIASVGAGVTPLLALSVHAGGPSVGEVVKSARGLAVIVYLLRALGRHETARLVRAPGLSKTAVDETAVLSSFIDRLQEIDRGSDAHHVLRILSSPELNPTC